MPSLPQPLEVATCIACGARSRFAECEEGCDDVPIDLVEEEVVGALADHVAALRERVGALRTWADGVTGDTRPWQELRGDARAALALPVPEAPISDDAIVEAWGCRSCGRVDAPQPCLGVCVRRPVLMVDASAYRRLAAERAELAAADAALGHVAHLAAHVTPRAGREGETRAAIAARVRVAVGR